MWCVTKVATYPGKPRIIDILTLSQENEEWEWETIIIMTNKTTNGLEEIFIDFSLFL